MIFFYSGTFNRRFNHHGPKVVGSRTTERTVKIPQRCSNRAHNYCFFHISSFYIFSGFRVQRFRGSEVQGSGFRVQGSEVRHLSFDIRYSIFIIQYSLFDIRYFGFRVQRFVICHSIFDIHYSLFIIRYSLFRVQSSELMVLSISTLGILDHFRHFRSF